jgi:hypothetical protein
MAGSIPQTEGCIGVEHVVADSYVMSDSSDDDQLRAQFLLSRTGAVSDVGATLIGGEGAAWSRPPAAWAATSPASTATAGRRG